MICNCIDKVEANTLQVLREKNIGRTYEEVEVWGGTGLQNVSLQLGENPGKKMYFEYKAKYTFIKTNGEQSAEKTDKINLYPPYCPFCGNLLSNSPDPRESLNETIVELSILSATEEWNRPEDSRDTSLLMIKWAKEFEEMHKDTRWEDEILDYTIELDKFFDKKVNELTKEG